jgi:hypothetical protein
MYRNLYSFLRLMIERWPGRESFWPEEEERLIG